MTESASSGNNSSRATPFGEVGITQQLPNRAPPPVHRRIRGCGEAASMRNTPERRTGPGRACSAWPVSAMRRTCPSACTRPAKASTRSDIGLKRRLMLRSLSVLACVVPRVHRWRRSPAAQAGIAVVQHQGLSRRDRALWVDKADFHCRRRGLRLRSPDPADGSGSAPCSSKRDAGGAPSIQCAVSDQSICESRQAVRALIDIQHVVRHVLPTTYQGACSNPRTPPMLRPSRWPRVK